MMVKCLSSSPGFVGSFWQYCSLYAPGKTLYVYRLWNFWVCFAVDYIWLLLQSQYLCLGSSLIRPIYVMVYHRARTRPCSVLRLLQQIHSRIIDLFFSRSQPTVMLMHARCSGQSDFRPLKLSNLSVLTDMRADWLCKQLHTRMCWWHVRTLTCTCVLFTTVKDEKDVRI